MGSHSIRHSQSMYTDCFVWISLRTAQQFNSRFLIELGDDGTVGPIDASCDRGSLSTRRIMHDDYRAIIKILSATILVRFVNFRAATAAPNLNQKLIKIYGFLIEWLARACTMSENNKSHCAGSRPFASN